MTFKKQSQRQSYNRNRLGNQHRNFSERIAQLRSELDLKHREEARLIKEINDKMSQTNSGSVDLNRAFGLAVSRLNNALLLVETDTKQLANTLKVNSKLADSISSKVSSLDEAKTRVVECLQLAGDMRDLGVSSEQVDAAISGEDFEQAAHHIHRFLTLDKAVFQLRDSSDKEAGQSIKQSYDILTTATARLKEVITRRLNDAVERNDDVQIKRFVRLFPLINEHFTGLEIFGHYVSKQIAKLGDESIKVMKAGGTSDRLDVLYSDTLIRFFDGVALIIETSDKIIANGYGPERYLEYIKILQNEIDKTAQNVVKDFIKSRQWDRIAKTVEKYLRDPARATEKPDAPTLDKLLNEVVLMQSFTKKFSRFLERQFNYIENIQKELTDDSGDTNSKKAEAESIQIEKRKQKLAKLLNESYLGSSMQDITSKYIQLEHFYMLETINKAINMDHKEDEQMNSSVIDDVLFLCRRSIRRSLSSNYVDGTCAVINNASMLLETTFYEYISETIKSGYPSVGYVAEAFQTAQTAYNVLQHGKSTQEAGPDAQREQFILAVNNARATSELITELKDGLIPEASKLFKDPVAASKFEHSVSQFVEISHKMSNLADAGISSLCVAAFCPRIKTSCDQYIDLNHVLNDDQLSAYEMNPWVDGGIAAIDKVLAPFQASLHPLNYKALLISSCGEFCKQFERVILKCSFNRLGGLLLDKEFRQITSYFSAIGGWPAREKCTRLAQIVALFNVDSVEEACELWRQAPAAFVSEREIQNILTRRVDLPTQNVQQVMKSLL
ncbi:unnamed protein product, partial [Mesorhabditis belari]|uniref:Conserved oligomeric Golgi complex subunit 4 n=1 Tax=Mesorhabditis belari TaxID=2138241 RepID=A0AAF3J1K0_9BILA